MSRPISAVLAGHSYISRLEKNPVVPRNLDLTQIDVKYYAIPGGKIADLRSQLQQIVYHQPSIVVLQIGGNDMTGSMTDDNINVPGQLIDLSHQLLQHKGLCHIYTGMLFYRARSNISQQTLPSGDIIIRSGWLTSN